MGEESKFIGEYGEEVVAAFLNRIGRTQRSPNFDIPCVYGGSHKGGNGAERRNHGLDFVFCYPTSLFSRRLDAVVGSVKYSSKSYPKSPSSRFKSYTSDLNSAIECFRRSDRFFEMKKGFSGVDRTEAKGVLFWLSGGPDVENIMEPISSVRTGELTRQIAVVDNLRFAYLWKCIDYVERRPTRSLSSWNFAYHATGHNQEGTNLSGEGKILPFELLVGGPVVLRLNELQTKIMVVCCPETVFCRISKIAA